MARVIAFDINETTLSLDALAPGFERAFGTADLVPLWFALLLQSSTVAVLTRVSVTFAELGAAALDNLAARRGITLGGDDRQAILGQFQNLTPHPDVAPNLQRLREAGLTTVALSNSSGQLLAGQLGNAGLAELFDHVISVETIGYFKPAPQVYQVAAERLGVAPVDLCLIAAHDWDTHGALRAGCQAAYVQRSPVPYNPHYDRPAIVGGDMNQVVDALLAQQ